MKKGWRSRLGSSSIGTTKRKLRSVPGKPGSKLIRFLDYVDESALGLLITRFEKSTLFHLAVFAGAIVGGVIILDEFQAREREREQQTLERADMREDRVARAWQILSAPSTGSGGKSQALQILVDEGVELRGLDLSCETMGGGWNAEKSQCDRPIIIRGVDFSPIEWTGFEVDPSYSVEMGPDWERRSVGPGMRVGGNTDGRYFTREIEEVEASEGRCRNEISSRDNYYPPINSKFQKPPHPQALYPSVPRLSWEDSGARARGNGVVLADANLSGVIFEDSDLSYADFSGARLDGTIFRANRGVFVDFRDVKTRKLTLTDSFMPLMTFSLKGRETDDQVELRFNYSYFAGAIIETRKEIFSGFTPLKLEGTVSFSNSDLKNAELEFGIQHDLISFSESNLTCANIRSDFDNVRILVSNISDAKFRSANFEGVWQRVPFMSRFEPSFYNEYNWAYEGHSPSGLGDHEYDLCPSAANFLRDGAYLGHSPKGCRQKPAQD